MTVYLERGYNLKEHQWFYKQYQNIYSKEIFMIYVGIDVAKDKHDCFITNSDGEVLFKSFREYPKVCVNLQTDVR